jgi:predicted nucleic acid-binding protein
MSIPEVPDGTRILVDANIVLYVLAGKSLQCRRFLERCADGSIEGIITTVVAAEICHRRMILEAAARGLIAANPARALGRDRAKVRKLSDYAGEMRDLLGGGLTVEAVRPEDFLVALEFQNRHGLLTNDSLNLAAARRLGLRDVATADSHFDGVSGWRVFRPRDLR